jgi:hypothetical protein
VLTVTVMSTDEAGIAKYDDGTGAQIVEGITENETDEVATITTAVEGTDAI